MVDRKNVIFITRGCGQFVPPAIPANNAALTTVNENNTTVPSEVNEVNPSAHPELSIETTRYIINERMVLGTGGYAVVVTGTKAGSDNDAIPTTLAIKIIDNRRLRTRTEKTMVAHEREVLLRIRHTNIIRLHDVIETPERTFLVMDYMRFDLFEYMRGLKALTEGMAARIMFGVLKAVACLHSCNVIHRDIKMENVLLNDPDDVKLTDFGLAKLVELNIATATPCGSSAYLAPEIIDGVVRLGARARKTTRDDMKSMDLWSCGVVLHAMLTGDFPFEACDDEVQRLRTMQQGPTFTEPEWRVLSPEARDLTAKLLEPKAGRRLTAAQALKHKFFEAQHRASEVRIMTPSKFNALSRDAFHARCAALQGANEKLHEEAALAIEDSNNEGRQHYTLSDPSVMLAPISQNALMLRRRSQKIDNKNADKHIDKVAQ